MDSSLRLPAPGTPGRATDMQAAFGAGFSMALVVCLCGVLIACFEMVSAQMQSAAQARAEARAAEALAAACRKAAEQEFNKRYYPLIDCPLFRMPKLQRFVWMPYQVRLPEPPDSGYIPVEDCCPQIPLYPVSFPTESYAPTAAAAAPAPQQER
ncbi:hypothetical protein [Prosthecobacter sp.]|uniref:hypothetical protein n=1 Tax=Prosthecobacter sp. TaxID=1965333 RepID=UPI003783B5F0